MSTDGLPPGPAGSSFSIMRRWMRHPTDFLRENAKKFGDSFTVKLPGGNHFVMIHKPSDVHDVFAADPDRLRAGESNFLLKPLLGSNSVLILDGPAHRRQRRLLMPPFHGERMRAYAEVMRTAASRALDTWPIGEPFPLLSRMQSITLDVILRAVFGIDGASPEGVELAKLLSTLLDSLASPFLLLPGFFGVDAFRLPFLPMSRHKQKADRAIYAQIARRRAAGGGEDILSLLLQAKDEDGKGMTDEELRDELMTLLVAGHETTATSLAWAFDALLHEKDAHERLVAEVRGGGDPVHLPFLEATAKETLRLRPVLPLVGRVVMEPWSVGGFTLPKGSRIAPCIWLVHRRPEVYADPDRFQPERFLGKTPDPSEYLPFGGGNRRCIGAAFAVYEMQIVLATLLARARFEAAGEPEIVQRRSITFTPGTGTRVVMRERANA